MSGLLFGPANGWLTFVPYPHSEGLPDIHDAVGASSAIALAAGETVLQYEYAEDHGWSFTLVTPNQSMATFACGWDQEPPSVFDNLDRSALDGIVAATAIEPFLVASSAADDGTPHAHGFAERLGLPAYRWLSPDYVEKDTQHFINAGARKMGRKPAKPATTKLPSPSKLDLPKPGLTAREALTQLKPMLKWCHPPWTLRMVSGSSRRGWDFRYYNSELGETVQGYLFPNGNVSFKSLGREPSMSDEEIARRRAALRADPRYADLVKEAEAATAGPPIPIALPDNWFDSNEVLAIAETVEAPEEVDNTSLDWHLTLQCGRPARWHVRARADSNATKLSWTIELDAQTGKLLRQVLSRGGVGPDSWIIRPWRQRIEGGPWKDVY